MRTIYLDHNATSPILPEVAEAIARCYADGHANPASQHGPGRRARHLIEDAGERIAQLLGAKTTGSDADRLIFTSGGTEANNLAMLGLAGETPRHLAVSSIEHPSVLGPAEWLESRGWQVSRLSVNRDGVAQIDDLRDLRMRDASVHPSPPGRGSEERAVREIFNDASIREPSEKKKSAAPHRTFPADNLELVALMLGNNETGVLQPVARLAEHCTQHDIRLHTDAVQAVGKIAIDFRQLGAASLAFTAHKFHGPRGIGGLLVRSDVELRPLMFGGFQQAGLRPGTEDVALIVGMCRALEIWDEDRVERTARLTALRDGFEAQLVAEVPRISINGQQSERLPHTSNVAFTGVDRQALSMALDLEGIACSTGSACASGSSEPSTVLVAMGLSEEIVASSLRFSFGATTTAADVDEAVERIARVCQRLRACEIATQTPPATIAISF